MIKNITTCLFLIAACMSASAQLTVTSVSPTSQSMTAERVHEIEITFSEEVSPFTFSGINLQVFGRWSGPMVGNLDFNETFTSVIFIPEGEFIAGEMVTVSLNTEVLSAFGDTNLTHGYAFNYWIKTEPAGLNLDLIQTIEMKLEDETFIQCYGAYAGDLNDDGYSDLTVVNEDANDLRVLLNDGAGGYSDFTIYGMPSGFKPSPNEGADFNHDGFIDLAVAHVQSDIVSVLMGDGAGGFLPEVGYTVEQGVRGLSVIDLEADGHPDIVTANRNASSISLLTNNSMGEFEDIIHIPGMSEGETAMAVADANEDGIMDLFVGAYGGGEVFIMLNDGDGNFSNGGVADVDGQVWMVTTGDVNGDGHVDLVSANSNGHNCSVHFGDGEGGFSATASYDTGNFPLAIDLGDLDGDGDLDMITSNYSGTDYTLFENDGNGIFINPITYPAASAGSCAIFHDRDNNGTLDLTLVDELQDLVFIYDNSPIDGIEDVYKLETFIIPNPFTDQVSIGVKGNHIEDLIILDMSGKVVAKINPTTSGDNTTYDWRPASDIGSGMYLFQLPSANISVEQLIKL